MDGGPPAISKFLKFRILSFPIADHHLNLVVVTHIDNDRKGGMLPFFHSNIEGLTISEAWFNGLTQLSDPLGAGGLSCCLLNV